MSEQIPSKQLVALVKGKVKAKQSAFDAMSHITAKLKSAKKDANLNKKAFDIVFAAYKMDEDDRNEFFDQIALYRDYMDENNAWADGQHTGDLVKMAQADAGLKDEKPEDPAAAEAAAGAENAKKLKGGIKKLPEGDGKVVKINRAAEALNELAATSVN